MINRVRCGVVLAACWSVLACSDPAAPDPLGSWGGEGASVVVTASLTEFEFDCAHGQVEGVLALDGQGSFSAEGVYVREGGPVPSEGHEAVPARYQGTVAGDRMTLFVLLEGSEPIGPRQLRRGEEPLLRKCL
ncbi:MAG: hypothetical protein V3T24_04865 [Longimicrobiales bacterium]